MAKKGNLKTETESHRIVGEKNIIKTNYIKTQIDNTQRNSKCRIFGDRNETIIHIQNKCRKLAQKYKTRFDWVGKIILKFKFDHSTKCYM